MKVRQLTLGGVLLAVGLVLHLVMPPIFLGVKPDFLLAMMFFAIMSNRDLKSSLIIGLVAGLMSAATTGFPGGQLPNLVDKIITSFVIYQLCKRMDFEYSTARIVLINIIGTLLSGGIFLTLAFALTHQLHLWVPSIPVVLLAAVVNTGLSVFIYHTFATRSSLQRATGHLLSK